MCTCASIKPAMIVLPLASTIRSAGFFASGGRSSPCQMDEILPSVTLSDVRACGLLPVQSNKRPLTMSSVCAVTSTSCRTGLRHSVPCLHLWISRWRSDYGGSPKICTKRAKMFSHGKGRSFHVATLERGHDCRVLTVITLASLGCQYFLLLTNPSVAIADVVDGLAQRHENRVPRRLKERQVKISIGLF